MAQQNPEQQPDVKRRMLPITLIFCGISFLILGLVTYFWPQGEPQETLSARSASVTAPITSDASSDEEEKKTTEANDGEHALDPVLEIARKALAKMRVEIRDYTATLLKRERIGRSLSDEAEMELKMINAQEAMGDRPAIPVHVYLKFNSPSSSKGREVIWIEGQNKNQLIAHEGGFKNFLRMNLDPQGTIAMMGNRYPITGIGMIRLVEKLIEKGTRDRELGPCSVRIIFNEEVDGRPCQLIQVTHPTQEQGMDFHIAQIFFDTERMIPLRYAAFGWPQKEGEAPPLEEEYTYLNVRLNVGLTAEDFNPDNPEYQFP